MNERTLTALYDTQGAAEAARDELVAAGVPSADITIHGTESSGSASTADTGSGRGFCVGQDLTELSGGDRDVAGLLRERWNRHVLGLQGLEKPVLAAVNGAAAGAGLSLACGCDLRIAADKAAFVPAFITVGLVPDTGGSWLVPQLLGYSRAFEWMCSNRRLSAQEALEWGLVSEVIDADGFEARVAELAADWAARPTLAIGRTKQLFEHAYTATLDRQLELEAELQHAATQTEDFAEGVQAFLDKRPADFKGR